ncbi:tail fiber domain-containing protein [Roseicitreum antarcticum]|uniref:Chaperone of endosialidase n=1 Tax=Roseicitreum antarcticum TaxID=564137 RepID=A0A1H3E7C9_9RHOB|nr:tail fiber domain-containing protein [Roseicitreum antarcticum]SDX74148.1 Chaperone of endosialidase [Roseicitreum antarcticum]
MGKSAPGPDPRMGEAALMSAQTGERYLAHMQGLSSITQGWAEEDRERYQTTFQPLEDQMIEDAQNYDSPERRAAAASEAVADVRQQSAMAGQQRNRQMGAMGVNPASGRFAGETRRAGTAESLSAAGAGNMARRQVEAGGEARMASVVNMGRGMAVNPATSMGMAGNMSAQGHTGAMQGHGQMANIFGQQHSAQMAQFNANNSTMGGIGGALGSIVGALPFTSDENAKKNKSKAIGVLDAVKNMRVEQWDYKAGEGDGGRHVGPYAQEFQRETGLGDGKSISVIDAIGVNMGATKELAAQVERLEKAISIKEAA